MITKKPRDKNEPQIVPHTFPVQVDESVLFAAKGAYIDKAVLIVGERVLSVIVPDYGADVDTKSPPPDIDLKFFRDIPLHCALFNASDTAKIVLYTSDGRTPSIVFKVMTDSVRWEDIRGSVYCEKVYAWNDTGEVFRTLVYSHFGVGYARETSPSTNNLQVK